jgi:tetratricopeptide (TPR) repeat protein
MTSLENAPSSSKALPRPLEFMAATTTPGLAGRALSVALAARVPLLIALVTFAVFSPALWNQFVDWDDQVNFLTNNDYRGLGWTHLRWMFTSFLMGQWIPLTWMTLGLDYTLWGMKPLGYHLTNLLLHAANAAVFFLVARRLLTRASPSVPGPTLTAGAGAAALFFALHPLRAESVAWVTERRDLLSGLFFLLTVLTYLAARDVESERGRRWTALSILCYALACLSKSMVVTLPAILLLLDVYPLRRLHLGQWRTAAARALIVEKAPYFGLAAFTAIMAVWAQQANHYLTSLESLTVFERGPLALFSLAFYASKTVLPVGLSPLYELPARINPLEARFALSVAAVIMVSVGVTVVARRWMALPAVWIAYAISVAPVSGILHNGHQLAHDRYSYLSCLPLALLFGGAMAAALVAVRTRVIRPSVARMAAASGVAWLIGLSFMTWHQVKVWHDNDTLWRYALDADPECAICHSNLGVSLYNRRILDLAMERFERSIALRPDRVRTHGNLGLALMAAGRSEEAVPHFEMVLAKYPMHNETRNNLAVSLLQLGRYQPAVAQLLEILRLDPDHVLAHTNLGSAFLDLHRSAEAAVELERAAAIKPDLPQPRVGLIKTYLALGRVDAARSQLEILRGIDAVAAVYISPMFITEW